MISHVMQLVGRNEASVEQRRKAGLSVQRMFACQASKVPGAWDPIVGGKLISLVGGNLCATSLVMRRYAFPVVDAELRDILPLVSDTAEKCNFLRRVLCSEDIGLGILETSGAALLNSGVVSGVLGSRVSGIMLVLAARSPPLVLLLVDFPLAFEFSWISLYLLCFSLDWEFLGTLSTAFRRFKNVSPPQDIILWEVLR